MGLDLAATSLAGSWYFLWLPSFHRQFSLNVPFRSNFVAILVLRKNADVTEGVDWTEMLEFWRHCSNVCPEQYKVADSYLLGTNTQRCSWACRVFIWNCQAKQLGWLPSDSYSAAACCVFVTQLRNTACVLWEGGIEYARVKELRCDKDEFASLELGFRICFESRC